MKLFSFLFFFIVSHVLLSIVVYCELYCFSLCKLLFFAFCVQVLGPLPLGGNPIPVNKYRIIK